MRSSRRATLASGGVVWKKYEYNYVLLKDLVGYTIVNGTSMNIPTASEGGLQGYIYCDVVLKKGKYFDSYVFEYSEWDESSTVYNGTETGRQKYTKSGTTVRVQSQTIENRYENERYEWWVEDYVGTVRSQEGKYPDAGRGYTFVKTDGAYTIMADGEKHYAYKKG
jgi:hypothetical protein